MASLWLTIGSLSLGETRMFLMVLHLEVSLNAISTTDLLDDFTKTLCVGYDNVTFSFDFISDRTVVPWLLAHQWSHW